MNNICDESALNLILSSCSNGSYESTILAKRLHHKFGSLYNIVNASEEDLCSIKGMNKKKLQLIKSLPNILEAYLKSSIMKQSSKATRYKDVIKYFMLTMMNLKFEIFSYAIFDIKKRVIEMDSIFRGSISSSTIYPREIIEIALNKMARYIVVAHNHPGGTAKPSDDDILLTKELCQIFSSVDIVLMDHIIIAKNKKYSFKKKGLIDFFEKSNYKQNQTNGEYYA